MNSKKETKKDPTQLKSWSALKNHFHELNKNYLKKDTFKSSVLHDPLRFGDLSFSVFDDFFVDFSKNFITSETIELFCKLSDEIHLRDEISRMFSGESINETENRAVLHTAMRNMSENPVYVNNKNIMPEVHHELSRIEKKVTNIHTQKHLGYSNKPITDIVNIGIGGSDLGPYLVCEALQHHANKDLNVHFVSNIDAFHISQVLQRVNPETVLFVIVSKSLRTIETKVNAETALNWLVKKSGCDKKILMKQHFVAVSNNVEEAEKMGIDSDNLFPMFDSVGGRFSLWSGAGISIPMYIGFDNFKKLLYGAYQMDSHFKNTEFNHNVPALLGFMGIWYTNFFEAKSHAILPYDQALNKLPDYFQQSHMESNGKSVDRNGQPVNYSTCPVLFGTAGTNGQHSFYQLLHQGTSLIPADFLAPVIPSIKGKEFMEHHTILLGNFFGQTEALMCGKDLNTVKSELKNKGYSKEDIDAIAPFKVHNGNNPSTSILYQELVPETLGKIIAMYEQKIFVQGAIWNIFSFDQWGVEFGKELASKIYPELKDNRTISSHDPSTNGLINQFKKMRQMNKK